MATITVSSVFQNRSVFFVIQQILVHVDSHRVGSDVYLPEPAEGGDSLIQLEHLLLKPVFRKRNNFC